MPQLLASLILPIITQIIGAGALASAVSLGLGYGIIGAALYGIQALMVRKPAVPKAEDGKYNLKQNVPSLVYALGTNNKASDYLALEEKGGVAYHVLCVAAHRISGFVSHQLHDEIVTLHAEDEPDHADFGKVIEPEHFQQKVKIKTRLGLDAETAYADMVAAFPAIWTPDHRGDGLATVMMTVASVSQESHLDAFPQGMPAHRTTFNAALLYDPRDDSTEFTRNLALFRLWHLTHPVGGKLGLDDMYLPDWRHAADVADEEVLNRAGEPEPRYHGGLWFRAENDPVEVGRLMDQAAEMVVFERPDGLIGVHAGEFVAPDIRLTADSIRTLTFDANTRLESNVLAVRGRYTSPPHGYNTVDAAITGDPYIGEDSQRSRTLANQAVQSHNHMQRLQRIKMIRDNAPRVSVVADYDAAEDVPFRRFVQVHYPPYCDEAVIELTANPKTSLRAMTVEFSGIVVPPELYAFIAATDEGVPPPVIDEVPREDIPVPDDFAVTIQRETLANGAAAAYGLCTWAAQSDALLVEIEWQRTPAGPTDRMITVSGETQKRTPFLADGLELQFRARNWSGGGHSDWTDYVLVTPIANPNAPGALTAVSISGSGKRLGGYTLNYTTPSDANLFRVKLYRTPTGVALNRVTHLVEALLVLNATAYSRNHGDTTRVNLFANADFATGATWTLAGGWSIATGTANHTATGVADIIRQAAAYANADVIRFGYTVSGLSAGSVGPRLDGSGGGGLNGTLRITNGTFFDALTATGISGTARAGFVASTTFAGSIDDVVAYIQTAACLPAGVYDIYAEAVNASGVAGPLSGPHTITVV